MDPRHFDSLTRSLTAARSRRGALAALLAGALGPFGLAVTVAKKKKRKGKGKKGKDQNPSPPPSGSCVDGIKNGSETDVDCGGSCPRCVDGRSCGSRNDCATALCNGGTCQAPNADADCGSDSRGRCYVGNPVTGGSAVCTTGDSTGPIVTSCASCPPGTNCFDYAGRRVLVFQAVRRALATAIAARRGIDTSSGDRGTFSIVIERVTHRQPSGGCNGQTPI